MAITEKRFYPVSPQQFTADGNEHGQLQIADASIFKVGQIVIIQSSTVGPSEFKIKRIPNQTTILVGPTNTGIQTRSNISQYKVADGAFIFANEQVRPTVPEQEVERDTFEEEPVVARRTILVDKMGDRIDQSNPLPVVSGGIADPEIFNISVVNSGQEYSCALPNTTKRFTIKSRSGNTRIQLSFTAGQTNTNFLTLSAGSVYSEENLQLINPLVIYIECNKPNQIIEIISWS